MVARRARRQPGVLDDGPSRSTHREQIRLAGGVRDEPGGPPDGGLWILDNIKDRAEAVRLCEDDPFFTAGLRQSYVLKTWGFAPCYADVTL